jgi:hypothetical protein
MKIYLLLGVLFGIIGLVNAQTAGSARGAYADIINPDIINSRMYDSYKGSPYSSDEFMPGVVLLKSGDKVNFDEIRIDYFSNLVIFKQDGTDLALDNTIVNAVWINEKQESKYIKVKLFDVERYPLILVEGDVNLLKLTEMNLILENRQSASSYAGNTDVNQKIFKSKVRYFWTSNFKEFNEVTMDNDELINSFLTKSKDLESFMKSEKIRLRKEEDLIKVFNKINLNGL